MADHYNGFVFICLRNKVDNEVCYYIFNINVVLSENKWRSYDVIKTIIICLGNNVGNNLIIIITRLAPTCHWRSTETASPTALSFSTFLFESSSVDPTPSSSLKIFKTTKSSPSNIFVLFVIFSVVQLATLLRKKSRYIYAFSISFLDWTKSQE